MFQWNELKIFVCCSCKLEILILFHQFEFLFGGQYISGAFLKFSFPFVSILALKKVFAEHKDIQKLAEKFILLNLVVSFPVILN